MAEDKEPTVWITYSKFHSNPECPRVHGSPDPKEAPVSEVGLRDPCRKCLPGMRKGRRRVCELCSPMMLMPCRHNGGVKVASTRGVVWTWPERAVLHTSVVYDHTN